MVHMELVGVVAHKLLFRVDEGLVQDGFVVFGIVLEIAFVHKILEIHFAVGFALGHIALQRNAFDGVGRVWYWIELGGVHHVNAQMPTCFQPLVAVVKEPLGILRVVERKVEARDVCEHFIVHSVGVVEVPLDESHTVFVLLQLLLCKVKHCFGGVHTIQRCTAIVFCHTFEMNTSTTPQIQYHCAPAVFSQLCSVLKVVALELNQLEFVLVEQLVVDVRVVRVVDAVTGGASVILEHPEFARGVIANGWFVRVGETFDVVLHLHIQHFGGGVEQERDDQHQRRDHEDNFDHGG